MQAVYTARPVYTGARYTPPVYTAVQPKSIANNAFCTGRIYGPYIRVTGTHYPYIRPVHTARMYGPHVRVSKMHPYIRAVNTVHTTRIELLFCTGRIYGPYIRVSKIRPYVRAVHTARIYGPYLRVVRIGLNGRGPCAPHSHGMFDHCCMHLILAR